MRVSQGERAEFLKKAGDVWTAEGGGYKAASDTGGVGHQGI